MADKKQISMAASCIALRGVKIFLNASKAAAARKASPPVVRRKPKPPAPGAKPSQKVFDALFKSTKFNKFIVALLTCLPPFAFPAPVSVSTALVALPRALLARAGVSWVADAVAAGRAMAHRKLKEKTLDSLHKCTNFTKYELEALYTMYRSLVVAAQSTAPAPGIGQPAPKTDGIDQSTFRDVMHNTFDLVTEEAILERIWVTWERGPSGGEGAIRFEAWARGLSRLLRGTEEERRSHCFAVYDLNGDGWITKDEMFLLLKNSLLKQPGDEDPDEGVRDLVELVLRKLDIDKDGRVSFEDYRQAVEQEPLLLEAFGQCLPSKRHSAAFLRTLVTK